MTLQNLYSLRIILNLINLISMLTASINFCFACMKVSNLEFSRELLINLSWAILGGLLIIILNDLIEIVSKKIREMGIPD